MIDLAVPQIMLNHAGLTDLIGTRVFPLTLGDRNTLPAVTYQKVSDVKGPAGTGIRTTRFQVSCIAETLLVAKEVAVQIKAAFNRRHETISGVNVFNSSDDDEADSYDAETGLYRVLVDVVLDYKG